MSTPFLRVAAAALASVPCLGCGSDAEQEPTNIAAAGSSPQKQEDERTTGPILVVKDHALFARGKLPALHEGLADRPRGLMVGLPGGLSFEYGADDVELLAVRRGGFVDRTNWNERDGGELKPLGEIVFEVRGGGPRPWLSVEVEGEMAPFEFDLGATKAVGRKQDEAELELQPKPGSPPGLRRVVETLFQPKVSELPSFGCRFVFETTGTPELMIRAIDCVEDGMAVYNQLGGPLLLAQHPAEGTNYDHGITAWIVQHGVGPQGGFDCLYFRTNFNPSIGGDPTSLFFLLLQDNWPHDEDPMITMIGVHVKEWDEALLERLTKELAR